MTVVALGLVLSSGLAHAGWNYLLRTSGDKLVFSWCFTALASVLYLPLAAFFAIRSPVPPSGWAFILGTMALHILYFQFLNRAYTHGDLSLAYPVARGTGVALIPLGGVLLLGEQVSLPAVAAIAVILAGVLLVHTRGIRRRALHTIGAALEKGTVYAFATGLTIAAYSLLDKRALSVVPPPVLNYAIFLAQAMVVSPVALRRREALRREIAERKGAIVAAAVLSPLAYLLVLAALTFSRVSYVAPAREIGIVVGALMGTFLLREPYGASRLLGSALITTGVITLALAP
ncbi:MAG: SMR family transporter [Chloroflexota bacterium]